jgi:hypothetical protein
MQPLGIGGADPSPQSRTMVEENRQSPQPRYLGLDVACCIAILGMVLVNFTYLMETGENDPDWLLILIGSVQGRAAAIFVVLAVLLRISTWPADILHFLRFT